MARYRNTVTGREVESDGPDAALDAHPRWERIDAGEAPAEGDPPAGNASTEAWRAYAVTRGLSADEAAGLNRDELRERFGG